MNSFEIADCLQSLPHTKGLFRGVYPENVLKSINPHNGMYVVNLDPWNKPGSHWVAIWLHNEQKEYFSSYGRPAVTPHIAKFLGDRYKFNDLLLQHPFSIVCGQYCVYFLCNRADGHSFETILGHFSSHSLKRNDLIVAEFMNKTFKHKFEIWDKKWLKKQLTNVIDVL